MPDVALARRGRQAPDTLLLLRAALALVRAQKTVADGEASLARASCTSSRLIPGVLWHLEDEHLLAELVAEGGRNVKHIETATDAVISVERRRPPKCVGETGRGGRYDSPLIRGAWPQLGAEIATSHSTHL